MWLFRTNVKESCSSRLTLRDHVEENILISGSENSVYSLSDQETKHNSRLIEERELNALGTIRSQLAGWS